MKTVIGSWILVVGLVMGCSSTTSRTGLISWYQVSYSAHPNKILKDTFSVDITLVKKGSVLNFESFTKSGQFQLFGFEMRGDSCYHQGVYVPLVGIFRNEELANIESGFRVYNYNDPDTADEESFLFINSENELIAIYNWAMGPLLILTFDGKSPDPIYDFVLSESTQSRIREQQVELPPAKPVINFSGDTLQAKTFPDSIYHVLLGKMLDAKALAEQHPDSAELAIWYGRRVAYMGRYHEAIDVFSEAIKRFPNDSRLLRHRGHRYLTTRQLDLAIADYEKANDKSKDATNAIEPDGIPNKLNQPLGNDKFNIYYHQALAYYLNGEFEKAVPVYKQCMAVSDNDDLKVATSYWLYMTLHRLGMEEDANKLLGPITAEMNIVENDAYLDLLMLFKKAISVDELLEKVGSADALGNPTLMYGIGNWHLQQGNVKEAKEVWKGVLTSKSWDSFGYIAAEAERFNKLESVLGLKELDFDMKSFLIVDDLLTEECRFDIGCDCCYELLDFHDGTFTNRIPCVSEIATYYGTYSVKFDQLIISYSELGTRQSFYDEGDTTFQISSEIDSRVFNLAKCKEGIVLNEVWSGGILTGVLNYLDNINAPLNESEL